MQKILKVLLQIPPAVFALVFGVQGALWYVRPETAARSWGIDLPEGGMGLSGMIGAMSGFGFAMAVCLALALIRRERVWYYPPIILFLSLGTGRFVAGMFHGAPVVPERYIPEFAFAGLLLLAARIVAKPE